VINEHDIEAFEQKDLDDMTAGEVFRGLKGEVRGTITTSMMSVLITLLAALDGEDVPISDIGKIRDIFEDQTKFGKLVTHTFLSPLLLEEVQLIDAMFKRDVGKMLRKCTELQAIYAEEGNNGSHD